MPKKKKKNNESITNISKRQVYNIQYYSEYEDDIDYLTRNGNEDVADSINKAVIDLANKRFDLYSPHKVSKTNDGLDVYDIHPKPPNLNNNVSILYTYDDENLRIVLRLLSAPYNHKRQDRSINTVKKTKEPVDNKIYFNNEEDVSVTLEQIDESGESIYVTDNLPSVSKLIYSKLGTEHKVLVYPKEFYNDVRYFISIDKQDISVRFKNIDDAKNYVINELAEEIEQGIYGSTIIRDYVNKIDFDDLQYVLNKSFEMYYTSHSLFRVISMGDWSVRLNLHVPYYRFQLLHRGSVIMCFGMNGEDILFQHCSGGYSFDFLKSIEDTICDILSEYISN